MRYYNIIEVASAKEARAMMKHRRIIFKRQYQTGARRRREGLPICCRKTYKGLKN